MAKINKAKLNVVEIIKQGFQKDYIGEFNGKHYVWSMGENGKVQIAISLTQPKNPIGEIDAPIFNGGIDFSADTVVVPQKPTEISEEEKQNIKELMERLGL